MGSHVGTHIDALAHISQDGRLFGGSDAAEAGEGGGFEELGAHTIEPIVRRGLHLDVAAALGVDQCEPGYEITVDDLATALDRQSLSIESGDVVLVRTGWGARFAAGEPDEYVGHASGVPGIGTAAAAWLAARGIHAAGTDTIAFERVSPFAGHAALPVHRILIVENGIYIIEALDLEALSRDSIGEFVFILSPLALVGATGSPVRPLALVDDV
jgi:kynurenine formamidase